WKAQIPVAADAEPDTDPPGPSGEVRLLAVCVPRSIPSTRRSSPQPAATTSLPRRSADSGSWLDTTHRIIDAACRCSGKTLVHGTRHGCGTDGGERGSQPEPGGATLVRHAGQTHKLSPRSSGDRATVS